MATRTPAPKPLDLVLVKRPRAAEAGLRGMVGVVREPTGQSRLMVEFRCRLCDCGTRLFAVYPESLEVVGNLAGGE